MLLPPIAPAAAPRRTRSTWLIDGLDGAPPPEPMPAPASDVITSPPVGDAAKLALNAAALQKTSMRAGTVRVYKGRLLQPREQALINGIHSADVSYIEDRRGHGRSTIRAERSGAARARGPAASEPSSPHGTGRASADEAARQPASRADVVAVADHLRLALLELPASAPLEKELDMWDAAFAEVVRQVYVHCNERGQLLEAIRKRYGEVVERLTLEMAKENLRPLTAGSEDELADADKRRRNVEVALKFTRAAHYGQTEQLREQLSGERSSRLTREGELHYDLEQLRAQKQVVVEQLAEARRRISELEAVSRTLPTLEDVLDDATRLPSEDQPILERRLLSRPIGARHPALLASMTYEEGAASQLLSKLLMPLVEGERLNILRDLCHTVLPTSLGELCKSLLARSHLSGRDAGEVLASALRSMPSAIDEDQDLAGGFAPRSSLSYTTMSSTLFDELGQTATSAPEFHAVARQRLGPLLLSNTTHTAAKVADGTEASDAIWQSQLMQRDATIDALQAQVTEVPKCLSSLNSSLQLMWRLSRLNLAAWTITFCV